MQEAAHEANKTADDLGKLGALILREENPATVGGGIFKHGDVCH